MSKHLVRILVVAVAVACWPVGEARASLSQESLRAYIGRLGARVDSVKGNMFVTSLAAGKGRIEIRLLNDAPKQRLGFYAYGLGNAANAGNPVDLYAYLLQANSELAIGTFFVDKDQDIGYKFLIDTRDPLSYDTFSITYLAMVNVLKERGPVIREMLNKAGDAPKPDDVPDEMPEDQPPPPATEDPGAMAFRTIARPVRARLVL